MEKLPEDNCYCHTSEVEQNMLFCKCCKKLFHPGCLKAGRPSSLVGDIYFRFVCAICSSTGEEHCERIKLQWTTVVALSLYNLQLQGGGKRGCFRWREHICNFIDRHWTVLFGQQKKKTATWHGTVAGTLSSGCPALFVSGMESLGESGWWSLKTSRLPTLEEVETMITTHKAGKRSKGCPLPTPFPLVDGLRRRKNVCEDPLVVKEKKNQVCFQKKCGNTTKQKTNFQLGKSESPEESIDVRISECNDEAKCTNDIVSEWLTKNIENGEELESIEIPMEDMCNYDLNVPKFSNVLDEIFSDTVSETLNSDMRLGTFQQIPQNVKCNSGEESAIESDDENNLLHEPMANAKKFQTAETGRKRKAVIKHEPLIHQQQIHPRLVMMSHFEEQQVLKKLKKLEKIVDTIPEARRLCQKLKIRKLKRERNIPVFDFDAEVKRLCGDEYVENKESADLDFPSKVFKQEKIACNILDRYQVDYSNVPGYPYQQSTVITRPMGLDDDYGDCFISPYTSRLLKPIIWQDHKVLPPKLRLLQEIIAYPQKNNTNWKSPSRYPIDYCYVRPHHIPIVNAICQEFFWPGIDLSECLQYPEFSCIALYRKVLVGFAFMMPDANCNEGYLTYIFTHPDWRNVGIASFMLYHLIQTCTLNGKDITLHVAHDNSALLLYQKLGFKIEECIVDFFDKYLPSTSRQCRTALRLRLSV